MIAHSVPMALLDPTSQLLIVKPFTINLKGYKDENEEKEGVRRERKNLLDKVAPGPGEVLLGGMRTKTKKKE